jgi:hypothetical protein
MLLGTPVPRRGAGKNPPSWTGWGGERAAGRWRLYPGGSAEVAEFSGFISLERGGPRLSYRTRTAMGVMALLLPERP